MKHLLIRALFIAAFLAGPLSLSARAKEVKVEWDPIEGSVSYELEIASDSKVEKPLRFESKKTGWKGDLPFGVYLYRIRGKDRAHRPGDWTDPTPLVVTPSAPEAIYPGKAEKVTLLEKGEAKLLKWTAIPNAQGYRIRVLRGSEVIIDRSSPEAQLSVIELTPGAYTWSVQALVKATGRGPASLQGKEWEGKAGAATPFTVDYTRLDEPSPIAPLGRTPPPPENKIRFSWKKVPQAKKYELTLEADPEPGQQAAAPVTFKTEKTHLTAVVPKLGKYRWKVRALASATTLETARSESQATFDVTYADYRENSGYVGFSTLFAPYQYRVRSSTGQGSLASEALTLRLTGETWLKKNWGVGGGMQRTLVKISNSDYSWMDFEAYAKYKVQIGKPGSGFLFVPKAGLEYRQYLFLSLPTSAVGSGSTFSSQTVGGIGPSLGFDVRKSLGERWSLGMKVTWFQPMLVMGGGKKIGSETKNFSAGLQAFYWSSSRWGLGLGVLSDKRSFGHTNGTQGASTMNVDALHLFGSILLGL